MLIGTRRAVLGSQFAASDVPQSEARALIDFYNATDGGNWANNSGWCINPTVNNWNGVTVSGGHVTQIDLTLNDLAGDASNTLDPLAANLTSLKVSGCTSLTGLDVSSLTALTYLYVYGTGISTLAVAALTDMVKLYCQNTSISSLDVSGMTKMTHLYCYETSITALAIGSCVKLAAVLCQDNDMSQAQVDAILETIYTNWAGYTDATPELNIGGTNATPSGVYQDGDPPTTGLEYIYEICNDPETTGNETWAVTWNGGSAP